ncbi:hypothetical protein Lsai_1944 [Legionella sainthelensi]|uniref:Uncharacterized protein n=1 Tax=Legionella sainthelensi TaxID=28087 RepID=A0A0W0YJH6_9GAMM|nr:hypothetical protein [Legionella sainthelensi]KTD56831.1 hypothetical protein Lsai_1944 [Legionella sainthelensi]VEH33759.1 Uncharacterised protein [Legionella sainthelensi]
MKQDEERDYYKNMMALTNEITNWLLKGLDPVDSPNQKQQNPNQLLQNTNATQNNQQTLQNSDSPQLSQLSSSQTNTTPLELEKACGVNDNVINKNTSENDDINENDNTIRNDSTNSFSMQ